jgi:hypothetical protein
MKRVLTSDGVLVLLTTLPEFLPEKPSQSFEVSVYGQNPQVMLFSDHTLERPLIAT